MGMKMENSLNFMLKILKVNNIGERVQKISAAVNR